MTKILILFFIWSLSAAAFAWHTQAIQDSTRAIVPLSAREITRINVVGDRIQQLVGPKGSYRVEHNERQGDMYVQPLVSYPFTVFLQTEQGHHLTLLLTPMGIPADNVRLELVHGG